MLGCRAGTTFMRDFLLPVLSRLLIISPFAGLYFCSLWSLCWLHSPKLLQPVSPSVLRSDSAPFRPRLPYYPRLCGPWQPGCCCPMPLCDRALWPSLAVKADRWHF